MQPTSTNPRTPSWRRTALVGSLALSALAFAACGSSSADTGAGTSTKTGDAKTGDATTSPDEVTLKLVAIHPDELGVAAGTTVTWKQLDRGVHTVTSGTVEQGGAGVTPKPDGRFDSGELTTGTTFTHAFAEPGTYPYFCQIHPATMRGEITVR